MSSNSVSNEERIERVYQILPKIRETLARLYGDRLLEIVLYGSFACKTFHDESDVDIAVVLRGKVNKFKEIDRIYDAVYPLLLETGELISINPLSEEEVANSTWPLAYHIQKEGLKI